MYEKWTDEELRKAQRQNRLELLRNELYIVAFFAVMILMEAAAARGMWWLLCGGAGFLAVCVFVYSLCAAAARADDIQGTR